MASVTIRMLKSILVHSCNDSQKIWRLIEIDKSSFHQKWTKCDY